jgi:anti-sigma factor RsiW
MMTCDRIRRLLPEFLDGELAAAEQFSVQAHLDACGACAGECEAQRRLIRLLADAPRRALGSEWDSGLRTRIASIDRQEARGHRCRRVGIRWDWRLMLAPAAAAALLIALWRPTPAPDPAPTASERAYVSRLVGQHVAGARARNLPEQEAVDVALSATSLGSLIE